ncbi:MAG: hypothetical protein ABIH08_02530, partial [Candidatus Omnitrophota bacterium]
MNKILAFLPIFILIPFFNAFPIFRQVRGIEDAYIKRVAVSELNPELVYAASKNSLYKSIDGGDTFQKTDTFKDEEVQHLFFDPYSADTLYLATLRHIFKITDKTEKIFSSLNEEDILTVAKFKEQIYAGTDNGIYFAFEDTLNWQKLKGLEEEVSVYSITSGVKKIYFAASEGVYSLDEEEKIKSVFTIIRETDEDDDLIRDVIKIDLFDKDRVWLGTNKGLFISENKGLTWEKLYPQGLGSLFIHSLSRTRLENNGLYLGTNKGFFRINLETLASKQIFEGLYTSEVLWVEFSPKGEIYLATPKGLFKNDYFTLSYQSKSLEEILKLKIEPSIQEVQDTALRYNEIHPDKIRNWSRVLKFRALFPTVSLDYDKTVDYDAGADKYYIGPYDWGVSCSWNIGDLIWNSYEDD